MSASQFFSPDLNFTVHFNDIWNSIIVPIYDDAKNKISDNSRFSNEEVMQAINEYITHVDLFYSNIIKPERGLSDEYIKDTRETILNDLKEFEQDFLQARPSAQYQPNRHYCSTLMETLNVSCTVGIRR